MVTSLERRLTILEQATGGGDGCYRCADTTVVYFDGGLASVSRRGQLMSDTGATAFVAEEAPDGVCPVCKGVRAEVVVGWEGQEGG